MTMETLTAAEYRARQSKPRNKYRAIPVVIDNIRFASRAEAARYGTLKMEQTAGFITGLTCHPRFELHGRDGSHIGFYTGDFEYTRNGIYILEDVKSRITASTAAFRRTQKLMMSSHGIEISVHLT